MSATTATEGDFDHPNQHLRRSVIIALYFAFILSTVAVGLRLLARRVTGSRLHLDDYLILIALLFKYGCSIGVVIVLFNGLGSHITMIPKSNLTVYFKIGWSNSIVYTGCIAFTKLSILAMYKRLFTARPMLITANILSAIVILWALAVSLAGVFNCLPVNRFWDRTVPGTCMDTVSFYYGQQIPNILTDLVLLVMPLPSVWSLPISRAQRGLLTGVFAVGGLTLAFDVIRLVAMIDLMHAGPDITYNQVPVAVWTCIEAAVGITAACLSHLRPLFNIRFWAVPSPDSKRPLGSPLSGGWSTEGTLVDVAEAEAYRSQTHTHTQTQHSILTRHSVCVEVSKA
ncbi:integral membrane protein [Aspergillus ellipticus CBS 707.79]|uniref:Integral membrane protein n=1 Tax=Aspergillus ellipticus CBS 707.79 TaxID=1448320 RepID=A0A319DJU3_9EURO|nr:integral membrane protein [Aspergillus ellipticus CBS 707.79]